MKSYKKVLLALELDSVIDALPLQHASDLVKECDASLYFIHVVEHMGSYGAAYGVAAGADIESILMEKAHTELMRIAKTHHVDEDKAILKPGSGAHVILDEADRLGVDLIIVGSHIRHGLQAMLGSTSDGVVSRASCDVLAVRVNDD